MAPGKYRELVKVFPQICRWSTYLEPRSLQLQTHREIFEFGETLESWGSLSRKLLPGFRIWRNLKLLEMPIPPSRHFAAAFRDLLITVPITELNLKTSWDDKFQIIAGLLGYACDNLRVLRIKHIVSETCSAPIPWEDPTWNTMLACFKSIQVLYINTPLRFKSWKRPYWTFCLWKEFLPNLQRIYLCHGSEEYDISSGNLIGDFRVFSWVPGPKTRKNSLKWREQPIVGHLPGKGQDMGLADALLEDREPYGPWDDHENAGDPTSTGDDPAWASDSDVEMDTSSEYENENESDSY
ncbi:hypothetical protein BDN72DRAFT_905642 [Pluteus cervinus]|uniref:Uncharacterized protein n=1 Tax=Pluteus cervinus TaxID=181527 RepID=A0ACD3A294_9AGAR|nr:hypothetical protein BDN72DRAFT_905642 [Pluteus cervinus]